MQPRPRSAISRLNTVFRYGVGPSTLSSRPSERMDGDQGPWGSSAGRLTGCRLTQPQRGQHLIAGATRRRPKEFNRLDVLSQRDRLIDRMTARDGNSVAL